MWYETDRLPETTACSASPPTKWNHVRKVCSAMNQGSRGVEFARNVWLAEVALTDRGGYPEKAPHQPPLCVSLRPAVRVMRG